MRRIFNTNLSFFVLLLLGNFAKEILPHGRVSTQVLNIICSRGPDKTQWTCGFSSQFLPLYPPRKLPILCPVGLCTLLTHSATYLFRTEF